MNSEEINKIYSYIYKVVESNLALIPLNALYIIEDRGDILALHPLDVSLSRDVRKCRKEHISGDKLLIKTRYATYQLVISLLEEF